MFLFISIVGLIISGLIFRKKQNELNDLRENELKVAVNEYQKVKTSFDSLISKIANNNSSNSRYIETLFSQNSKTLSFDQMVYQGYTIAELRSLAVKLQNPNYNSQEKLNTVQEAYKSSIQTLDRLNKEKDLLTVKYQKYLKIHQEALEKERQEAEERARIKRKADEARRRRQEEDDSVRRAAIIAATAYSSSSSSSSSSSNSSDSGYSGGGGDSGGGGSSSDW